MNKRWLSVLVGMLLILALACALPGGSDSENGDGGLVDLFDPGTGDADDDDGALESPPQLDPEALEGLDSYRARIVWRFEADAGESFEMNIQQEVTRDPSALRAVMTGVFGDEDEEMEIIQIGDTTWTSYGGEWFQMQSTEDSMDMFGDFITAEDLSNLDDSDYEYQGRETVNGIRCRHYRLRPSAAQAALLFGQSDLENFEIEMWVADESNLPEFAVRAVVTWTGNWDDDEMGHGRMTLTQEIYDINANFTIEPPSDVDVGGLPEDVPMYDNVTNVFSMAGMTTFESPDTFDEIVEFYDRGLPANGWTQTDTFSYDTMMMSTWEKGGRVLTVNISEMGENVSVMLMVEE